MNMNYHIKVNLGKLLFSISAQISAVSKQSYSMRRNRLPWAVQNDE